VATVEGGHVLGVRGADIGERRGGIARGDAGAGLGKGHWREGYTEEPADRKAGGHLKRDRLRLSGDEGPPAAVVRSAHSRDGLAPFGMAFVLAAGSIFAS